MKTLVSSWLLLTAALAFLVSIAAFAKAAEPTGTSLPRPALRGDHPLGPFTLFDTNHDGVLSSAEIAAIPAALQGLDQNHDGQLTAHELCPRGQRPPVGDDDDLPPPPPDL